MPPIEQLITAYRKKEWVLLPGFVESAQLPILLGDLKSCATTRVSVGLGTESWTQYDLAQSSSLGPFLMGRRLREIAQEISQQELSANVVAWAQSYASGERIAWHRDRFGVMQLLICLQSVPNENGGAFCIRANRKQSELFLGAGDAVLFNATRLPHCTTRIAGTGAHLRITAVARYLD